MKSLIIGAAGFVGAYLIRHLKQEPVHVVAVTKLPQERLQEETMGADEIDIYDLDIDDP